MVVRVTQVEEVFGGGKNGWRKGLGSAIRTRGAYTLRNES